MIKTKLCLVHLYLVSLKLTSWLEACNGRHHTTVYYHFQPFRSAPNNFSRYENMVDPTESVSDIASQNTSISEKQATAASCSLTNSKPPSPLSNNVPSFKKGPKSWTWHLFSQLVSLLWLGPIITLLVLNFRNHAIGASIWCPFGKCASDAFSDNAIATAVRYVLYVLVFRFVREWDGEICQLSKKGFLISLQSPLR